jgi:prepilin-type N-terminal cleavage/methylation domain-containing protein
MNKQSGFTLTEITLAMAIFGFLLAIVLGSVLMFMHIYQQSSAARDVQQNARSAMEQIVRASRTATDAIVVSGSNGNDKLCIANGSADSWLVYFVDTAGSAPMLKTGASQTGDCSDDPTNTSDVLSRTVQAVQMTAKKIDNTVTIDLTVANDASRVDSNNNCDPTAGVCSVTSLQSSVDLRKAGQ